MTQKSAVEAVNLLPPSTTSNLLPRLLVVAAVTEAVPPPLALPTCLLSQAKMTSDHCQWQSVTPRPAGRDCTASGTAESAVCRPSDGRALGRAESRRTSPTVRPLRTRRQAAPGRLAGRRGPGPGTQAAARGTHSASVCHSVTGTSVQVPCHCSGLRVWQRWQPLRRDSLPYFLTRHQHHRGGGPP